MRDASPAQRRGGLIAATALAHDLDLFTCNPQDFARIDGLRVHAVDTGATSG